MIALAKQYFDIHGEERRTVVSFNEIPQVVKDATVFRRIEIL